MLRPTLGKELIVRAVNDISALGSMAKTIAEKGISILAVSTWAEGSNGVAHFVTDDNLRASEALRRKGYRVLEGSVVILEVPHKPGLLKHLAETLDAEEIDVHHLYATAPAEQNKSLLVFASSDNRRALVALNREWQEKESFVCR